MILAIITLGVVIVFSLTVPPEWLDAMGEFATALAKPVFIPMLNLLSKPAFVYIASFIIVLAAIVICALYYLRFVRPDIKRLKMLNASIGQLPRPEDVDAPTPDGALDAVGNLLQKTCFFVATYEEYLRERSERGRLPTLAFDRAVHLGEWQQDRPIRSVFMAMPSYFTMIGLILTFAGLVAALYFAARGFRTGNPEEAQLAIVQLLHASSFKFLTSVAALVGAFAISICFKLGDASVRIRALDTASSVDRYLRLWTRGDTSRTSESQTAELAKSINALTSLLADSRAGFINAAGTKA